MHARRMPRRFFCPHLGSEVELTDERASHILGTHPEFGDDLVASIEGTLGQPDQIRRSSKLETARLISRWYDGLRGGKHVVVVVVAGDTRSWIVTAYVTSRLMSGEIEWARS